VRELVHPSEGEQFATLISPVKGRFYIKSLPLDMKMENVMESAEPQESAE
jgi:hypothetical protein